MRCDAVCISTPGLGTTFVIGCSISGRSVVTPMAEAGWVGAFCGKRGVVFAFGGAPVTGGAEGFGGMKPEGGLATLGIGLVTAVDQAGGPDETGAGSN